MKKLLIIMTLLTTISMVALFLHNDYNRSELNQPYTDTKTHDTQSLLPESLDENIAKVSSPTNSPDKKVSAITLAFGGDVLLDRGVANLIDKKGFDYVLSDVKTILESSDISMVNLENPVSIRGIKASDKQYAFRAKPENLKVLANAGIDIVTLANNHILDYGNDALLDTFENLSKSGILFAGAGTDLDNASKPVYFEKKGTKVAFLASSHVVPFTTWYAGSHKPGVATTYDPTRIKLEISKAKKQADIVVVYIHWGEESVQMPVKHQKNLARIYIDEGADIVIGSHPHVLQGLEFYKGKIIAYSLGNFIFTNSKRESAILMFDINGTEIQNARVIPCEINQLRTLLTKDKNQQRLMYDKLESISFNIRIDNDGVIREQS